MPTKPRKAKGRKPRKSRKDAPVSLLETAYTEVITTCCLAGQTTFSSHYKHPDRARKKESHLIKAFLDAITTVRGGGMDDCESETDEDSDCEDC